MEMVVAISGHNRMENHRNNQIYLGIAQHQITFAWRLEEDGIVPRGKYVVKNNCS
jgi:hypothetical protein